MGKSEYQEILDYLYAELPMFQRVGAIAYKRDLANTIALCKALGNPERKFKSIHVGGTNGKGSSSHMIAAVLQCQGYKTGLYTSPHLKEFTERIRIDGREISTDYVIEFVNRIKPEIERLHPSFFEITVAMAFDYFASQNVDFAVIEVGLGGRLDSTNVINPLVSLITNIGYDHKELLGGTLEAIAIEKAGIIKANGSAVVSEWQPEIDHVFINKCKEVNTELLFASKLYEVKSNKELAGFSVKKSGLLLFSNLNAELTGGYQKKNIAGVLAILDKLTELGVEITQESIERGIESTISLTGLKGRWQKLGESPLIYCDTAHNAEGIAEVLKIVNTLSYQRLHIVLGIVKDKDSSQVLSLLPKEAIYYFCAAGIPRALDAETLSSQASLFGLEGFVIGGVPEAIKKAKAEASPEDLIFIGGSTFVVAEIEDL